MISKAAGPTNGGPAAAPLSTAAPMTVKKVMLPAELMPQFVATVLASTTSTKPKLIEELQSVFASQKVSKACLERQFTESVSKLKKSEASECSWEIIKK